MVNGQEQNDTDTAAAAAEIAGREAADVDSLCSGLVVFNKTDSLGTRWCEGQGTDIWSDRLITCQFTNPFFLVGGCLGRCQSDKSC